VKKCGNNKFHVTFIVVFAALYLVLAWATLGDYGVTWDVTEFYIGGASCKSIFDRTSFYFGCTGVLGVLHAMLCASPAGPHPQIEREPKEIDAFCCTAEQRISGRNAVQIDFCKRLR